MSRKNEIYVCEVCGNVVEILRAGDGQLVCCGREMTLQPEKTQDEAREKHVPKATRDGGRVSVVIGEIEHPSEPEHFIEWVELAQNGRTKRVELKAGDRPAAEFCVGEGPAIVRAYCNIHGLWKAEI